MSNYELIKADFVAWCKWKKKDVSFLSFVKMVVKYPEYRRLLDFRLSLMPLARFFRVFTYVSTIHTNLFISEWNGRGNIGPGLLFEHGFSTIVFASKIGANCCINQQVTIGAGRGGAPVLGNNVRVYAGAKIIGNVVIGDDVVVGANAVVVKDVPSHSIVAGVPAKVIKRRKDGSSLWEKIDE